MTLDEAIIHAESKAWEKKREADNCFNYEGPWYEEKRACANEHKQLAEWLKELKVYRETTLLTDRPQGEWIDKGNYAECSNCGANSGAQFDGVELIPCKTNFCPNCGAKMK